MLKLDEPIIHKLESELAFILITEIELSDYAFGMMTGYGKKYVYEDGFVAQIKTDHEVIFSLTEEGHGETEVSNGIKRGVR